MTKIDWRYVLERGVQNVLDGDFSKTELRDAIDYWHDMENQARAQIEAIRTIETICLHKQQIGAVLTSNKGEKVRVTGYDTSCLRSVTKNKKGLWNTREKRYFKSDFEPVFKL
jgi:hypothetical protein